MVAMQTRSQRCRWGWLLTAGSLAGLGGLPSVALAQVVPDASLGTEASVVVPGAITEAGVVGRIQGGAQREGILFHSFSDFNVNLGQRLYFANPDAVNTIVGRVTGGSLSAIDGRLGVLGNADLVLVNPNGLIFGPQASLDLRGAFLASTAPGVPFAGGYEFSAAQPNGVPLLSLGIPLGLANWLPSTGAIASSASLAAGQDLTLAAQHLAIAGQLRAGGNLSLLATGTLTAGDSAAAPLDLAAGNTLTLQGNEDLRIEALAHPASGLVAGGDLVLRSDAPVLGDAYFRAQGSLVAQRLDGSLGAVVSPKDPVFEVGGDFALADFTGGSLQILAGGSVTLGTVLILEAGGPFNDGTVVLSNGTAIPVTGTVVPTLDVRAGTVGFGGPPTAGTPTSATIAIGSVAVPGGLVLLTNQYQPNPALGGDIRVGNISTAAAEGGGPVVIDSRGELTVTGIDTSGGEVSEFFNGEEIFGLTGNGGDVTLLAAGAIALPFPSFIYSYGLRGGTIALASATAITQANGPLGADPFSLSPINSLSLGDGGGGDVVLSAPVIALGGNVLTMNFGGGPGGNLRLQGQALRLNQATVAPYTFGPGRSGNLSLTADAVEVGVFSLLGTVASGGQQGNGGDVDLRVGRLTAVDGGQIGSLVASGSSGSAGSVSIVAQAIDLSGFLPMALGGMFYAPSSIFSSAQAGTVGDSGAIAIDTQTLQIRNGAAISTLAAGEGDAGRITVTASESIVIDGAVFADLSVDRDSQPSGIGSELGAGAIGRGGDITLQTPLLRVTNGGTISSTTAGQGDAGNIWIEATRSATFDGAVSFAAQGGKDRPSGASVEATATATGVGGSLTVNTPALAVTNGARLEATTAGAGAAGSILLNVVDDLTLAGSGSGVFASTAPGSSGAGGSIVIDPARVAILDGAQVSVASQGSGQAGSIRIEGGALILNRGLISAETLSSGGGNISLGFRDVIVLVNGSRISTTAGTAQAGGNGGNIAIATTYLAAEPDGNNDITANAFFGAGGSVIVTAQGIFGLIPRSRADLEQLLGTTDPALLDPVRLPSSDLTAISRGNPSLQGQVIVQSPEVDPSQGAVPLPADVDDATRLIAQGCDSGSAAAEEIGSLVVTGRGGLPPSPTDSLGGGQVLLDWATAPPPAAGAAPPLTLSPGAAPVAQTRPLIEAQALSRSRDGRVALVAEAGTVALSTVACTDRP
jgi:filamentous hemagglutinin family protein